MITKIKFSKAFPDSAMQYAAGKNMLASLYSEGFTMDDHAEELRRIGKLFGKYESKDERKSFSIVLSPSPKDNATAEQLVDVGRYLMRKYFPGIPFEMAVHLDKGKDAEKASPVLHGHIYGGVIHPITGKKMHLSDKERRALQDDIDRYVMSCFGWMVIDRRSASRTSVKGAREPSAGIYSWKKDLLSRVLFAYEKSYSFAEFSENLKQLGVVLLMDRKDGRPRNEIGFMFQGRDGKIHRCQGPRLDLKLGILAMAERWPHIRSEGKIRGGTANYHGKTQAAGRMGGGTQSSAQPPTFGTDGNQRRGEPSPCNPCPNTWAALTGTCEKCRHYEQRRKGIAASKDSSDRSR